jgi:hypothetical protein
MINLYSSHTLFAALRDLFVPDTPAQREERYLSEAVDHADLEYRMASQARRYLTMYPAGSGR